MRPHITLVKVVIWGVRVNFVTPKIPATTDGVESDRRLSVVTVCFIYFLACQACRAFYPTYQSTTRETVKPFALASTAPHAKYLGRAHRQYWFVLYGGRGHKSCNRQRWAPSPRMSHRSDPATTLRGFRPDSYPFDWWDIASVAGYDRGARLDSIVLNYIPLYINLLVIYIN
jgi:hypothetical protein